MDIRTLLAAIAFFFAISPTPLSAQEPVGLHIQSLTSAEYDAVVAGSRQSGEVEVIYACIPAGIIVFGNRGTDRTYAALRDQVMTVLAPIIPTARVSQENTTLQAAEAACETARGE